MNAPGKSNYNVVSLICEPGETVDYGTKCPLPYVIGGGGEGGEGGVHDVCPSIVHTPHVSRLSRAPPKPQFKRKQNI